MKLRALAFACACALVVPAALLAGENGSLVIPDFHALQREATDSVNISLDPWLIRGASALMGDNDPDSVAMKRLLTGIESIQIRSFEFATDFVYPTAAIDVIRQQLTDPGWTRMVQVHNRKDRQDVDIYLKMEQNRAGGFALIASEPRQLTIINIVGSMNMEDLPMLERHFHLAQFGLPTAGL